MSHAVKISDHLVSKARIRGKVYNRSTAGQIEYWVRIGQLAEENADLPYSFLQDILIGREERKAGELEPYVFGEGDPR